MLAGRDNLSDNTSINQRNKFFRLLLLNIGTIIWFYLIYSYMNHMSDNNILN
jgi:hypothetical protein